MSGRRLETVVQHLHVTAPGRTWDVVTKPFDADLFAITAKKHDWPSAQDNPVGYLLFLAWSASRRVGEIDGTVTWEKFREEIEDVSEVETQTITPTPPGPGPG